MARIRITATAANTVPTPPAGKATMFVDSADLSFKAKLPDGSLIPISATQEYIEDVFSNLIQDSSTINFTYDDNGNTATLEVIQSALNIFQIPVIPSGNLTSTNVGAALNELQSDIDDINDIITKEQIVIVSKAPGVGQFSSVSAALASITDASPIKPYLIKIEPGIYLENPFTLKPNVNILGSGKTTTILASLNPNVNFITGAGSTTIRDLGLTGATTSGSNLLYFSALDATNSAIILDNINFLDFNRAVTAEALTYQTVIDMSNCTIFNSVPISSAFSCIGNGSAPCIFSGSGLRGQLTQNNTHLFDAVGPFASLALSDITVGANGTGHFIHAEDGSISSIQAAIATNFSTGIHVPNTGTGARVDFDGILRSITYDIFVEHPNATGFFIGAADNNKVLLDVTSEFRLSFTDPVNSSTIGQVVVGDIRQANRHDRLANITKLLREGTAVGAISGGAISLDSGFTVDISAGEGFLIDQTDQFVKEITWNASSLVIPANSIRYVYVDTNGTIQQSASPQNLIFTIPLGRVTTNASGIRSIESVEVDMVHLGNKIEDFLRNLGPVFSSGASVSEVGTRGLLVTPGEYNYGINPLTLAGGNPITWTAIYRNGSGGWIEVSQSTVDNAFYDDGSGTLAPIPTGYYARPVLYGLGNAEGSSGNEKYFLVYPQQTYIDELSASQGDLPLIPSFISEAVARISGQIVQEGTSGIVSFQDLRPRLGFAAPSSSGSASHSGLLDLLNDDHPQYLLVNGTRPMSGNLDMDGNAVVDASTINGVVIQGHAARHLPNGADPLTTAAPPSGITDSTNAVGSANSFMRSDASIAHGNRGGGSLHSLVNGSAHGFMSSSDFTKLAGIEPGATADQVASEVPFTPVGSISATNVQTALAELDSEKQPLDGDLSAVAALAGTGLVTRTATNTMTTRTITGTAGEVDVTNGDGVSGNPTIALPNVGTASTVGATNSTLSITTDAKGRVTSKSANLISIIASQITDFANAVLNTVLTGYSVGTNTVLAATDTILQAFQKLQGQMNERVQGPASSTDNAITRYDGTTGKLVQNTNATIDDNGGIAAGNFIRPGNTSDTTNANIRYNNNELQGRINGVWRNLSIIPQTVSATTSTTTTSGTYSVISGMSFTTPAAGNYLAIFTASGNINANSDADIALHIDGVEQVDTRRSIFTGAGFGGSGIATNFDFIKEITLNGSQTVDVRFRENGSATFTIWSRIFILVPISR